MKGVKNETHARKGREQGLVTSVNLGSCSSTRERHACLRVHVCSKVTYVRKWTTPCSSYQSLAERRKVHFCAQHGPSWKGRNFSYIRLPEPAYFHRTLESACITARQILFKRRLSLLSRSQFSYRTSQIVKYHEVPFTRKGRYCHWWLARLLSDLFET